MKTITSSQNSLFKHAKMLKTRKYREESGSFLIEGRKFFKEAVGSGAQIENIFVSDSFMNSKHSAFDGIPEQNAYVISDKLMNELSDTETPQGIAAVVKCMRYSLESVLGGANLFIITESIQDPGNMGTIIRTADAAGFSGVFVLKGCVDIYNPKVLRSTMGSVFHIPIIEIDTLPEIAETLKNAGVAVFAADISGSIDYYDASLTNNAAVIIGNEARGITEEAKKLSDALVRIPMPGRAESLNASVAASLIMFESVRQRRQS